MPWFRRLGIALGLFVRVLFDGRVAARLLRAMSSSAVSATPPEPQDDAAAKPVMRAAAESGDGPEAALVLLGLLQTEGRLVDFVQQDISGYDDAEVGAVARVVHAGCRQVVERYVPVVRIFSEPEGSQVDIDPDGVGAEGLKLTGKVGQHASGSGRLQHCGWRATDVKLPRAASSSAALIICPAEVELGGSP